MLVKRYWLLVFATIVLLLLISLQYLRQEKERKNNLTPYFSYQSDELKQIKGSSSENLDEYDTDKWDDLMFFIVKINKVPPTTASKLYTYLLVAQKDAAYLSYLKSNSFTGSFDPLMSRVICEIVPQGCSISKVNLYTDAYSESIANFVFTKIKKRIDEDSQNIHSYSVSEGEEFWDGKNPITPSAGSWKPWIINDVSEFRAPPPLPYGSEADLDELSTVKKALAEITIEKFKAAEYWAGNPDSVTPSGIWLELANRYAKEKGIGFSDYLTMRANLAATMQDAFIACWDTKFTYWTKRPDMRDTEIVTGIPTPNFPSYTSGHSTVSAAAAEVLSYYFPEREDHWRKMAEEARDTRLWSGIHFPQDNIIGFEMGENIGKYAVSRF